MTKQKKRCVTITCFDANQPGFLDFSYRLKALADEFQLTVVSTAKLEQPELLMRGITYHVISTSSGKLGWLKYVLKCAFFIQKSKPDIVVLLHSAVAPICLLVRNIPICLYWNEHPTNLMQTSNQQSVFKNWLTLQMQKLFFAGANNAQLLMPIGEDHQQDLIRHGVSPEKICMLYMGVSENFLNQSQTFDVTSELIKLIYVGTVSAARGRDEMLKAMQNLVVKGLPVHLTIVGAVQSELSYCQTYIQENGLHDAISVCGRVLGEEVPAYLANADAAICIWQPSPWNQFNPPTKLFEYLVAGLPVLANNIQTHTRYIKDWETGLLFDYNATSLANAIQQLYLQRKQLPKLKLTAATSAQKYLWGNIEPIFIEKIRGLVGVRS